MPKRTLFFLSLTTVALALTVTAQERDRTRIPDKYRWNLTDIYRDEAAWRTAKDKTAANLPQLRQFKGRLTSSAATLADALDKQQALDKEISRLYTYVGLLADQDTRDGAHQGMRQEMAQLASTFSAEAAFIEPELTAKIFKRRYRVYEVPITYDGRGYEEGKKITWRDGVVALWVLLKYRFSE